MVRLVAVVGLVLVMPGMNGTIIGRHARAVHCHAQWSDQYLPAASAALSS